MTDEPDAWTDELDFSQDIARQAGAVLMDRDHHRLRLAAWLNERGATAVVLADPVRAQFEPMLRSVGARVAYEGGGVSVWRSPTSTWAARPPG